MGGRLSRRKKPTTPFPPYVPPAGTVPGGAGISRPGIGAVNPNQQRELMQANQTIQNLQNQLNALRGGMGTPGMPYTPYPMPGAMGMPPMPYAAPGMMGAPSPYAPPSPLLQQLAGQNPFGSPQLMQQQQMMGLAGSKVYRDTDFAALASIAGLTPADIALLHREFLNLTQNGTGRLDRVVFRQLLRDILMEVNNENVDRAIENIFVSVDRNHDGFIDFPEFVGAFKDVLKGDMGDSRPYVSGEAVPNLLADQIRASGVGSGVLSSPLAYIDQPSIPAATQLVSSGGMSIVPLASFGMQQQPMVLAGAAAPLMATAAPLIDANPPLLTLDPNQSSYVIATPGQYLITQPTALQCVPLPLA